MAFSWCPSGVFKVFSWCFGRMMASYYDLKNEKDYQIALTSILGVLFETHVVRSEVNAGERRCDILISPKKPNQPGYLFELKHSRAKREPSAANFAKIAKSAFATNSRKAVLRGIRGAGRLSHPLLWHCFLPQEECCGL